MAANILAVPFRKTHATQLSPALKQYISEKYDQHPNMFVDDLRAIDQLRAAATGTLDAHASQVKTISTYAAQLVWIGSKFPVDTGVQFSWYPALGFNVSRSMTEDNIRFELANVVFNLGSLFSQLAFSANRSSSDGLKAASNYLCQAVGVFAYLKDDIVPELRTQCPEDMDVATLDCLVQLMLAQAQECTWSTAVKAGYKDLTIAKLAAKVSDYYDKAGEYGQKSDAIEVGWLHHISAKHHHFAGAAQYRAACDCLERRKYGEEIARLQDTLACVKEGLKEAKWIQPIVLGDLNGLKTRVEEDIKRAEKDNDMIYLQLVPSKTELKKLDRMDLVKAKPPVDISDPSTSLGPKGMYGHPLFEKLVPYSVHVAASIYVDRRDRFINNNIITELESLNDRLQELLQSLNLPGSILALEKPLGIPQSLLSKAEEIRQQDGLHRLRQSVREVDSLKASDYAIYQEGVGILQAEAQEDEKARMKHGTDRWNRASSVEAGAELQEKARAIQGYFDAAAESDQRVREKMKEDEQLLRILEGPDRGIEEFVPSSRKVEVPQRLTSEVQALRGLLSSVSKLRSNRQKVVQSYLERAKADDINQALIEETHRLEKEFPLQKIEAAQFEGLFAKRLQMYSDSQRTLQEQRSQQESLVQQILDRNQSFVSMRDSELDGGASGSQAREIALQQLENAYSRWKEIQSNLDTGRKFYNDLAGHCGRFRDAANQWRYERQREAERLTSDLDSAMSHMSLNRHNSASAQPIPANYNNVPTQPVYAQGYNSGPGFPQQAYQATQPAPVQQFTNDQRYSNVPIPKAEPLPAPRPIQPVANPAMNMWSPNMGIKFGVGSTPAGSRASAGGPLSPGAQAVRNQHQPPYPAPSQTWTPNDHLKFS